MDRIDALVAVAHLKLRLETLQRHPEYIDMAIPNFQGLAGAMDKLEFMLESEATKLHGDISSLGDRGLAAIGKGREKIDVVRQRIAEVETFVSKMEGSNGAPLPDSSTSSAPVAPDAAKVGPNGGPRIL
jgi:hypothetical protein